jgi:hypothetical protein
MSTTWHLGSGGQREVAPILPAAQGAKSGSKAEDAVDRKRAAGRGARSLHGEYQGGVERDPVKSEASANDRFRLHSGLKSDRTQGPLGACHKENSCIAAKRGSIRLSRRRRRVAVLE